MTDKHTVKQHYVPRAFLKRWCQEDESFYPIKINKKEPPELEILKKSGVDPFCFENYFYANRQGVKDEFSQIVEDEFTQFENFSYDIMNTFEKKVMESKEITFDDKFELAKIMYFFHLRGKKHLEWSKKFTNEMSRKMFEMNLRFKKDSFFKQVGIPKEEMLEMTKTMEVDFGMAHHLKQLATVEEFAYFISQKYWRINISRKNEFIVTDSPFLDLPVKQEGFYGNSIYEREQMFSLSPRVHISMFNPKNFGAKNVNRKDVTNNTNLVDTLNIHCLMNSVLFGFHFDKNLLERLKLATIKYYNTYSPFFKNKKLKI